jgi:hypothetical protein
MSAQLRKVFIPRLQVGRQSAERLVREIAGVAPLKPALETGVFVRRG